MDIDQNDDAVKAKIWTRSKNVLGRYLPPRKSFLHRFLDAIKTLFNSGTWEKSLAYEAFLEELNANLEKAVLTRVEEIEGRVPAGHEVRLYGKKILHPDGGQEIFWRNRPVAKLIAPKPEDRIQSWKVSIVRDED